MYEERSKLGSLKWKHHWHLSLELMQKCNIEGTRAEKKSFGTPRTTKNKCPFVEKGKISLASSKLLEHDLFSGFLTAFGQKGR